MSKGWGGQTAQKRWKRMREAKKNEEDMQRERETKGKELENRSLESSCG